MTSTLLTSHEKSAWRWICFKYPRVGCIAITAVTETRTFLSVFIWTLWAFLLHMEWNELSGKGSDGSVCMFTHDNVDNKHYSLFTFSSQAAFMTFLKSMSGFLSYVCAQARCDPLYCWDWNKDQLLTFWPLNLLFWTFLIWLMQSHQCYVSAPLNHQSKTLCLESNAYSQTSSSTSMP